MLKKKLLFLLFVLLIISGCGLFKEKRSIEYLLDGYVKAYCESDMESVKDIFPQFYLDYSKGKLTQERLEKTLTQAKNIYGDDFNITYKINKKVKMSDEELAKVNKDMLVTYNAKEDASICYKLEGNMTFRGSKKEEVSPLETIGYCKYDKTWYLVSINLKKTD